MSFIFLMLTFITAIYAVVDRADRQEWEGFAWLNSEANPEHDASIALCYAKVATMAWTPHRGTNISDPEFDGVMTNAINKCCHGTRHCSLVDLAYLRCGDVTCTRKAQEEFVKKYATSTFALIDRLGELSFEQMNFLLEFPQRATALAAAHPDVFGPFASYFQKDESMLVEFKALMDYYLVQFAMREDFQEIAEAELRRAYRVPALRFRNIKFHAYSQLG